MLSVVAEMCGLEDRSVKIRQKTEMVWTCEKGRGGCVGRGGGVESWWVMAAVREGLGKSGRVIV